jgi:hypothetical protein
LLCEGLGRPAQAEEPATPRLPDTVEAVQRMSWEDMQCVFATIYADELGAVLRDGGAEAVRQRAAALCEDARRLLREVLAEPASA